MSVRAVSVEGRLLAMGRAHTKPPRIDLIILSVFPATLALCQISAFQSCLVLSFVSFDLK